MYSKYLLKGGLLCKSAFYKRFNKIRREFISIHKDLNSRYLASYIISRYFGKDASIFLELLEEV